MTHVDEQGGERSREEDRRGGGSPARRIAREEDCPQGGLMTSHPDIHHESILDQFTKQAVPFSTAAGIRDEAALRLVVDLTGAGPDDTLLDVACGPGLLVCAFARVVGHATGIDLTPAMLDR